MLLSPHLLKIAEKVFNHYLALDPESSAALGALSDKLLCFDITAPELRVYVSPRARVVDLLAQTALEPDCTVRASLPALLAMMRSDDPAQSIASGAVVIEGDSRIAQQFSDILKRVELDWDEVASRLVGDFAAHKLGSVARGVLGWARQTGGALQQDVSEYLKEESGLLPERIEIEHFIAEVDRFRSDVDRLEARIRRLERRSTSLPDRPS